MEINIGARVICKDGEAGSVRYVVVDRDTREATELVVDMSELLTFDVVVPIDLVHRSSRDAVYLACTVEELKRFPEYVVEEYLPPERTWMAPQGAPWDAIRFRAPAVPVRRYDHPRLEPGEVAIAEGMLVRCADGPCGNVDEILTDPQTDKVTSFVVRKGRLFHRDVVVPIALIQRITPGEIDLSISRKDLDKLDEPQAGPGRAA